jgi:hypothetical protein
MPTPAEAIILREQRQRSLPPIWEMGTIQTVGVGSATVLVTGNPETMPYGRTLDGLLAVGDRVVVMRAGARAYIAEAFSTSTTLDTQPPAVIGGPPLTGTSSFVAVDARTWQGNQWRTNFAAVAQGTVNGQVNVGGWFYGNNPSAALFGALVTGCRVQLNRRTGGAPTVTTHLYLHSFSARPAAGLAPPFVLGPVDIALLIDQPTWVPLPLAWGQQIVNNNYGLAISGDPPMAVKGLDQDATSGQLQIDWSRTP